MKTIAGIKRQNRFSPGHIENDEAIFTLTAQNLQQMGYRVVEYTEDEFTAACPQVKYIFNMVRSLDCLDKLKQLEEQGSIIVNSPAGIRNCIRSRMTRILLENSIPHPRSLIVDTSHDPVPQLTEMGMECLWIKRGDSQPLYVNDVCYINKLSLVKQTLEEFALRSIPQAVINEHLYGDLVKFYGVAGTPFFYLFYPGDVEHSKFGLEKINGVPQRFPFSHTCLKDICNRSAALLHVDVYGGDCIVASDGSFKIIDFNDWPSFAICREDAAVNIAARIDSKIQQA